MENVVEQSPQDIASAWGNKIRATAATDPSIEAAGGRRASGSGSASVSVAPLTVKTEDVLPLIRGIGAVATRAAKVTDLSADEARDIAEPAAHLLSIIAPDVPGWAIPLMTLSARVGGVVVSRSDEFRANNKPDSRDETRTEPTLVSEKDF